MAELPVAGALASPEVVWFGVGALTLVSVDVVSCVEAVGATDVGEAVTVLVVATAGEDTTLVGLRGLTGLVGFVGLVTLLTQVLLVVTQFPDHVGEP